MGELKSRRFNPCCGYYLKGAVKWICYVNIVEVIAGTIFLVKHMYELRHTVHQEKQDNYRRFIIRVCVWVSSCSNAIIGVPLDIYFCRASNLLNIKGMLFWMVATFLNTSWAVAAYYFNTFYFGIEVLTIVPFNVYVIYRGYTLFVVYSYKKELEEDLNSLKNCRNLTDEEIQEFETGLKPTHNIVYVNLDTDFPGHDQQVLISGDINGRRISEAHLGSEIQYGRYRKEDYEIPMNNLLIDEEQILGAGAYGKVYRGQLTLFKGSPEPQIVAVKTINHENSDVCLFKTLLTELKIMSYLGQHDHIISLIGACTAEIKQNKLFIVVEFCAYGSLFDYLRCNLGLFFSQVKDHAINNTGEIGCTEFEGADITTTKDLLKWCYQTADGMKYLESKKVIHGDLAARNILLTSEKNVKITDFGLSKQLYQYAVYAKRKDTPLPWRWLALESITDMNFSSKSDVWSFGITVWEIFSMGEAPWSDKSFTQEFITELKNGMRLTIPTNCTQSIYNMLLHCWHKEPNERPSFTSLTEFFKENHNYLV